jgi:acetolactate synthase-1/2/3 large subunit
MLMIGGVQLSQSRGLALGRIAASCEARVSTDVFPPRVARGEGTAVIERLPYLAELALDHIKDVQELILIGAAPPVSFFAYPDVPSEMAAQTCEVLQLADESSDIDQLLVALEEKLQTGEVVPETHPLTLPDLPTGHLDVNAAAQTIAHFLPDNAVVVDESNTSGTFISAHTLTARRHELLNLTGGAIGWGLPAAVGAAIACPERKVVSLEADGSAMYTLQALWTMAREGLDVTVVIFNNRKYSILELEFSRTGARGGSPGPKAASTLQIGNPDIDFVALAQGMGVPATRATTADDFNEQFAAAINAPGPRLIDAIVPPVF